ncbi:hypothetical protein AB0H73_03475 [Streptomyces olivoreticuli]|uniref:hypothetical protein n=1 Tax=Streptomyces olivoreticuli TaxID=68246 RepID=UPI0013C316A4|nr:hypothetical protein [Streptomyces olivoreticuli]
MKDSAVLPLMVTLGIITILLVRSRDVRWWEAVLIGLFGTYLGQTPVIFAINSFVTWCLSGFTHTHP